MAHTPRDILDRHALEIVIALALVGLAIAPPFAIAATGQVAMLVGACLVLLFRPKGEIRIGQPELWMLAVLMLVAVLLLGTSLAAVNPRVSFLGKAGQHTGSSLWLAASMMLLAVLARPRPGDVGRAARGVGLAGAVLAIAALADRAGLIDSFRFSPEPAGLLESSATLGQALVIGIAAAVAWALTAKSATQRYLAWGAAVLCAAAIGVSGARSAVVAVVIAAAIVWAGVQLGRRGTLSARSVGIVVAAVTLLGAAAIWVYFGADSSRAVELAEATNNRSVIWETAIARTEASPILGNGADQFSALVTWDASPDGRGITRTGTYDPHNAWMYWLVSAGVIGLLLASVGSGLLAERLWALSSARGFAWSISAMIAGVVAWSVVTLFMWVSSVALLMVVLIVGPLVAAGQAVRSDVASKGTGFGAGIPAFVVLAAVATMVVWWTPLTAEFGWGRAMADGTLNAEKGLELAQLSASPAAASVTVSGMLQEAGQRPEARPWLLSDSELLLPALEADAEWHVDAAYAGFQYEIAQLIWVDDAVRWDELDQWIDAGLMADPTSGIWEYSATVYADELGAEAKAAEYAGRALEFPLPDAAASFCEMVINRAGGIAPSE